MNLTALCRIFEGDSMEPNGKDALIEEIDKELRAIGARLKKAFSKTDALLKEAAREKEEAEETDNDKTD